MLWLFVLVTIPCGTGGRASPGIAHCELPKKQRDLNSFLWRVHRDPPAFLFGTIHVSYDLVWPFIPKNAKRALEQSHDVYFELELGEPATLGAIASCQKLPQGQRLREVLPASLYTRLKTHLDYVHFMLPTWLGLANRDTARRHAEYLFKTFVGDWERKRPVWLLVLLNWLTEADVQNHRAPLLDVGLAHMAAAGGKRTGAVERPEEQCLPLNMLSPSKVLFALNHTLQMQEMIRMGSSKATNSTKELINHYNCGDLSSIIFQQEPSQVLGWIDGSLSPDDAFVAHSIDHYLRQELIYKRNARMAQRVYSLLLRHPDKSFFFAFGVGHFLGNRSVINVLRDSGLHVEHVPSDRKIDSYRKIHQGHSFPQMARIRAEDLEDDVPWSGFDVKSTSESEEEKESLKNESPKLWERRRGGMNDRRFKDLWVRKVESKTLLPPARAKNVNMHVTMETTPGLLCVHKQSQTTSASPSAASNNLGLSLILSWVLINFG